MATDRLRLMGEYWETLRQEWLKGRSAERATEPTQVFPEPESMASRWRRHGMASGEAPKGFDTFRPALQRTPEAKKQASAALATFALWAAGKGKPWLLAVGAAGSGKTHLMKAALHSMVLYRDDGLYLTAATFDRRIKEFQNDPGVVTPDEWVDRLADPQASLLIDDIGAGDYDKGGS